MDLNNIFSSATFPIEESRHVNVSNSRCHPSDDLDNSTPAEMESSVLAAFKMAYSRYKDHETEAVVKEIVKSISDVRRYKATEKRVNEVKQYRSEMRESGIPRAICIKRINSDIGFGIFLREGNQIKKGELIGVYDGVIEFESSKLGNNYQFTLLEKNELLKISKKIKKSDLFESKLKSDENYSLLLNAGEEGNFTRFVNHTEYKYTNALVDFKVVDGEMCLLYIAKKTINAGEQILIDYGDDYWKAKGLSPELMMADTYVLREQQIVKLNREVRKNRTRSLEEVEDNVSSKTRAHLKRCLNRENASVLEGELTAVEELNSDANIIENAQTENDQSELSHFSPCESDQDLQTEQKKPGWSIEQLEANLTANLKKVFEERRRKEEKELSDRKKAEEWLYKPENRQLTTDVRAQMTSALQALGYRVPTSQNQDPPPHN